MNIEVIPPHHHELLAQVLTLQNRKDYVGIVQNIQEQVAAAPQCELPLTHYFAPDVYMRQMDAPAGALVVSKMHRFAHMNILLKGSVTVATEQGLQYLKAPCILRSEAGTKRVGYFHEDSSWVTVHPTGETCVEKIEADVIVPEEEIPVFLESLDKERALCHLPLQEQ